MEIDSFTSADMSCYASNKYFSDFVGVSARTVSKSINKLEDLGFIRISPFNGHQRLITSTHIWKEVQDGLEEDNIVSGKKCNITTKEVLPIKQKDKTNKQNKIILPWEGEEFAELWKLWKEDRSQRKIKKYTEVGEQTALAKLHQDTGGDMHLAMAAIKNSIAHGYQGIFPDKRQKPKPAFNSQQFDEWLDSESA